MCLLSLNLDKKIINSQLTDNEQMALNLTNNWQMAKILTDNWHVPPPPIQTLR